MIILVYIWFNFTANFFISEEKVWSHKTKQPLFHLGIIRNVNNFYKIVDIFQTILIFFSTKKWEITLLNYFHEYAILLHPNFSALKVDRASPMRVKRSGVRAAGRRKHHFREMRQPSAMSADDSGPVIGKWR
jgi:hypothetical protein